jgi:selenocysteine lyase/cysteine desulfurase
MPNHDIPTPDKPEETVLDIDFVRSQFPGLAHGWTFFDNAGGSQILKRAVERISTFLYDKNVQIGGSYAVSQAAAKQHSTRPARPQCISSMHHDRRRLSSAVRPRRSCRTLPAP